MKENFLYDTLAIGDKKNIGILRFFIIIFSTLRHFRFSVSLMMPLLFIQIAYAVLAPFIFKLLLDEVLQYKQIQLLEILLLILAIGFIFNAIAGVLESFLSSQLGLKLTHQIRYELFQKIQYSDLIALRGRLSGELLFCFSHDIETLRFVVIHVFWKAIQYAIIASIGTMMLFGLEWRMAILVVIIAPLTFIVTRYFSYSASQELSEKKEVEGRLIDYIKESILMQGVIRIFKLDNVRYKNFLSQAEQSDKVEFKYNIFSNLAGRVSFLSIYLINLLVFCGGVVLLLMNYITLGTLIGFMALLFIIGNAVATLSDSYTSVIQASGSLKNIIDLLSLKVAAPDSKNKVPFENLKEAIKLEHVSYQFPDNPYEFALSDISLTIKKGTKLAIVGKSGSGKSTIIHLLLGQYEASDGNIFYDDISIRHIVPESLLNAVAVVFQESLLFNATIAENIKMGKLDASQQEIEDAARAADIHDDICKMSLGYDTIVGEGGSSLSGGQRQRLAIARMLIHNPEIILLDEPTSALDPVNEREVLKTLDKISLGRTEIMVTHRLRHVMDMDNIVVMDQGYIVETGKHEALLEQKGLYYDMWIKQTGVTISEDGRTAEIEPGWLKMIPLFENLDKASLKLLADSFTLERHHARKVVFDEGEYGDKLYIIYSGTIIVSKMINGESKQLAVLQDGDFFGEIALLRDTPRTARIDTKTACVFLVLYYEQFHDVLRDLPPAVKESIEKKAFARESSDTKKPDTSAES